MVVFLDESFGVLLSMESDVDEIFVFTEDLDRVWSEKHFQHIKGYRPFYIWYDNLGKIENFLLHCISFISY